MGINEYDALAEGLAKEGVLQPEATTPFESALQAEKEVQSSAIARSAYIAKDIEPDRRARSLEISKKMNLPVEIVERNFDDLNKKASVVQTDYDKVVNNNPDLARWLEDPSNLALSKDDIDNLSSIDQKTKSLKRKEEPGSYAIEGAMALAKDTASFVGDLGSAIGSGFNQLRSGAQHVRMAYGMGTQDDATFQEMADVNKRSQEAGQKIPSYAKEYQSVVMGKESQEFNDASQNFISSFGELRKQKTLEALKNFASDSTMTAGELFDMVGAAVVRPRGLLYTAAQSAAFAAPAIGGALVGSQAGAATGAYVGGAAGSIVPGVGTLGGIAAGATVGGFSGAYAGSFTGSVFSEIGAQINTSLEKRGFDITNPQDLKRAYSDHKLMAEIRGEAERKGITTAAVDSVFNALGGKLLKGAKPTLASQAVRGAGELGIQTAGEVIGEGAGQVAVAKGDLTKVDFGSAVAEGISALGKSAADIAVGRTLNEALKVKRMALSKDPVKATEEIVLQTKEAFEVFDNVDNLSQLNDAIQKSKLKARSPEKFQEALNEMAGDQTVYFQSDDWDSHWTRQGKSPAVEAARVFNDDGKAYHQAKASGEALEIPLGSFLGQVEGNDVKALLPVVRLTNDGQTFNEAKETVEAAPSLLHALSDEAIGVTDESIATEMAQVEKETSQAKAIEDEKTFEESSKAVYNDVYEQLKATGMSPREAKQNAKLAQGVFTSMGKRANQDPMALLKERDLKINSAEDSGPTPQIVSDDERVLNQASLSPLEATRSLVFPVKVKDGVISVDAADGMNGSARISGTAMEIDTLNYKPKYLGVARDLIRSLERAAIGRGMDRMIGYSSDEMLLSAYEANGFTIQRNEGGPAAVIKNLEGKSYNQSTNEDRPWQTEVPYPDRVANPAFAPVAGSRKDLRAGFAEKLQGGTVDNEMTGWAIEFSKEGRNKASGVIASEGNRVAFANIDTLMRNAIYARSEQDRMARDSDIKAIHIFYAPFRSGGKEYVANIKVRETKEGKKFYDKFVLEKESPATSEHQDQTRAARAEQSDTVTSDQTENDVTYINIEDFKRDVKELQNQDTFFQNTEDENRGQIRFGANKKTFIDLFKKRDFSTFAHEMAHLYLEMMGDLAELDTTPQSLKDDYQVILKTLGVSSRSEIKTAQHEAWADMNEAYLMRGTAPSARLRKIFADFKAWALRFYKDARAMNVEISAEIRSVLDRIYATDEEIREAEHDLSNDPLFPDLLSSGMTEDQAEKYVAARAEARLFAEEKLAKELMADFEKARTRQYKEQEREVKKLITKEVDELPIIKAAALLKSGTLPDGSELPAGVTAIKLSKEALLESYDKDFVQKNLARMYSPEGGITQDMAAELLGYESGDQLVMALAQAPDRKELIESQTKAKMDELYPDLLTNGEIQEEAMRAVHNDMRAESLVLEMQHMVSENYSVFKGLVQKITKRPPTVKEVKQLAQYQIADKKVSEIKPHLYLRAEIKAAKEAGIFLAQGDVEKAFEAKRRELFNHELYRAAVEAKEEVKKAQKFFKKLFGKDEDMAKTRDMDMINAARAILTSHGLGKEEKTADEYLEKMRAYDPDGYATVKAMVDQAKSETGSYRTNTYDSFVALQDAVESLWSLAKSSREIEIDGQKLDREKVQIELEERLSEISTGKVKAGLATEVTNFDKVKIGLLGWRAALRRMESWADMVDGGRGVFTKYFVEPIQEAATRYRLDKNAALKRYLENLKTIEKGLGKKEIAAPEIGFHFKKGKASILGALLHTGNQSNKEKLLVGRGWGTVDENGKLDSSKWDKFIARMIKEGVLTKEDYDFLQSVWDLNEDLKPAAQKAHKKMYGHYFNEVTALSFITPFGAYRGGYVPAVVDSFINNDAASRTEKEELENNNNSFMFPTTGRGFTKSRVEGYNAELSIDLSMVPMHLDKVLRFIHLQPVIKDISRIALDKGFKKHLDQVDPAIAGDMIIPWLQRAAQQKVSQPSKGRAGQAADTFFRELRNRSGLQTMVLNVTNTLQQFTGFSIAAVKVKPHHLRNALFNYVKAPTVLSEAVTEKSDFMKTRMGSNALETQGHIDELILNPNKYEEFKAFAVKHGYILQGLTQGVVDSIVWTGAYDQAIEQGESEKNAIRAADSAVRLTQGSFNAEDISRFEAGTPFVRLFTMFYSFFNMQANTLGTEFTKGFRDMGLRKGAGRAIYVYSMGFMIPAALSEMLVRAMSGKPPDEDDDDEYMDDFMSAFFGSQIRGAAAMVPIAGPTAMATINTFNAKPYDDRITTSPAVSQIESAVQAPMSVYKAMQDRAKSGKAVRDSLTLLSLMTGVPLSPLSKPINYMLDVDSGKAEPTGPIDFTRGIITGKPGAK